MHDIYGDEIQANHHRDMLLQEAEHERKVASVEKAMVASRKNRVLEIRIHRGTQVVTQLRIECS